MYALRRQSPLAFPNRVPGFDPTHPASSKVLYSAVAQGANFVNILNGKGGTISGTVTRGMDGAIGPTAAFSTAWTQIGAGPAITPTAVTLAAIVRPTTSDLSGGSSGYAPICGDCGTGAGGGNFLGVSAGYKSGGLQFVSWGGAVVYNTDFQLSANVPYFIAVSATTSILNVISRNLNTGAIYAGSDQTGGPPSISSVDGNGSVGGFPQADSDYFAGPIACATASHTYLSPTQLLFWAADPWAFWCPHTYFDTFDWLSTVLSGGATTYFTASPGTYSITGDAITDNLEFVSSAGSYSITGDSITDNLEFVSSAGSYSITGDALTDTLELVSSPGTYSITGDSMTDTQDFVVSPGTYSISGDVTSELLAVSVSAGSYSLTGTTETYTLGVSVSAGQYLISGFMISSPRSGTIDNLPFIVTLGRLKSF